MFELLVVNRSRSPLSCSVQDAAAAVAFHGGYGPGKTLAASRLLNRAWSMFFPTDYVAFGSPGRRSAKLQSSVLGSRGRVFLASDWLYV